MSEPLGARLQRLRDERGWTLYAAATQAGMSPWALSLLERRQTLGSVRAASLRKVAELYGVSIDYLIRDTEPEAASLGPVGA